MRRRQAEGRGDTPHTPVPSTKKNSSKKIANRRNQKKPSMSENQFKSLLETFLTNNEAKKNLDNTNSRLRDQLISYTKEHGALDGSGNNKIQVGDMVSFVQISRPRVLNVDKVQNFIKKLVKRSHLTKKEGKAVIYPEYQLKLNETQYKLLKTHLEDVGVIADRELKVDETELELLIPKGVASIDEVARCYDEEAERITFRPSRLKE